MHRNSQHHLVGKAVVDTYLRRIGWVSGALFEDGSSHARLAAHHLRTQPAPR